MPIILKANNESMTSRIAGARRFETFSRFISRASDPMNIRRRLFSGTMWSIAGAVVSQGFGLLAAVITARLLGRNLFGQLGMIQSTAGMLGIFAGMGLGTTSAKYVSELRVTAPARVTSFILLSNLTAIVSGGVIASALYVLAPLISERVINAPQLNQWLKVCSVLLVVNGVIGAQTGALAGFEAFRALAQINFIRGVAVLPITAAAVRLFALGGAVWSLVIIAIFACLLNEAALRRLTHACPAASFRRAWAERDILWRFSVPAFFSSAMVAPVGWVASSMLVNGPNGYAEMGVFSAANQWRAALEFLPNLLSQVTLPILSGLHGAKDERRTRNLVWGSVAINALFAVPVLVCLTCCGNWIMASYGPEFRGRGAVISLTAIASALMAVQMPIGAFIAASARMWLGFVMNSAWAFVLLTSAYFFTSASHGADGLAGAYIVAYIAHATWTCGWAYAALSGAVTYSASRVNRHAS